MTHNFNLRLSKGRADFKTQCCNYDGVTKDFLNQSTNRTENYDCLLITVMFFHLLLSMSSMLQRYQNIGNPHAYKHS